MNALFLLLIDSAQADWGPFPAELEEYGERVMVIDSIPCSRSNLIDGVQLPHSPENYKIRNPNKAWGTRSMINVIRTATEEVSWYIPEADPLFIGDISTEKGGKLGTHLSHKGGSDADIGIYWGKGKQSPYGLVTVSPERFDARTNWVLIRSMLNDKNFERILVDQKLVDKLREYVIREGELSIDEARYVFPKKMHGSIWLREGVVHHHPGHKHHFHVRTHCISSVN